jgi:hypothetical protein
MEPPYPCIPICELGISDGPRAPQGENALAPAQNI